MITNKKINEVLNTFALLKLESIHIIPDTEDGASETLVELVEDEAELVLKDILKLENYESDFYASEAIELLTEKFSGSLIAFSSSPVFQGDRLSWGLMTNGVHVASTLAELVAKSIQFAEDVRKLDNPTWEGNYQEYITELTSK